MDSASDLTLSVFGGSTSTAFGIAEAMEEEKTGRTYPTERERER